MPDAPREILLHVLIAPPAPENPASRKAPFPPTGSSRPTRSASACRRGWRPARLVELQHAMFHAELPEILAGDGREFVTVEDRRIGQQA